MRNVKHCELETSSSPRALLVAITSAISYHAHTLYLFTADQVIDTVIPCTAFGTMAAMSGIVLDVPLQDTTTILRRIPLVSLWVWVVILQFCVQNQRSSGSIAEDAINKPWRPMPTKRLTQVQANYLLTATHILALCLSHHLNVMPIFAVYYVLITAYNDFGGGDRSGISRNLFCGAGFACYCSGALKVALGPDISISRQAWAWTILYNMGVLASTFHAQEFRDEVGDKARGRRTLVTEFGRKPALWSVIVTVLAWSIYLPLGLFHAKWIVAVLPFTFAMVLVAVAVRAMTVRSNKLDRGLYKLWTLWMFSLCPLPLLVPMTR
ncbi:UbiA prenyltransferase family-domain-containing protein [Phaeosphaeria sp. MPI-PUGE-AT-0046c]|nr:UbiA prenyltransferase family-domain-containing protein [Phaeosphaeria sp. MPI-PUGE-AT-0046c]